VVALAEIGQQNTAF